MAHRSDVLEFNAVTSGGRTFEIQFPLHPETRSGKAVSELVTAILNAINARVQQQDDISDGDILQALAMTLAIRDRMVDIAPETGHTLIRELVDTALEATQQATTYQAARA